MKIELVVFDMAGTTVLDNDAVNECLRAALAGRGIEVTRDEVNEVMGIAKPVAIHNLIERRRGLAPDAVEVEAAHDDFLRRMLAFYRTDPAVTEVPGASGVFRRLQESGVKVALNTGFSRVITDAILERLGWQGNPLINATVCSDEVARGRPHPDMIRRLMELTEVRSSEAVAKVGDTPVDLHEGQAAGCGLVIGVTYGSHTADELRRHPHSHLLDTLTALPALLGQSAQP